MNSYTHLFEGLTPRRVVWVTVICLVATGMVVGSLAPQVIRDGRAGSHAAA